MNKEEEHLQNAIERGEKIQASDMDARAYRQVFRAIEKDPGYQLPASFADRVVASVVARKKSRDARDLFWFGAGIAFLLLAFAGTIVYTGVRLEIEFLNEMSDYKGLAAFAIVFIAALNYLDKRLIRDWQLHNG